ncbi:MAG: hypothetical protein MZV70_00760 [Desulfobacterales bacterium]|nr:hypothetical protein [Desulfobacterales bacterium]
MARALVNVDTDLKPKLKKEGLLTRDPRRWSGRNTVRREREAGSSSPRGKRVTVAGTPILYSYEARLRTGLFVFLQEEEQKC